MNHLHKAILATGLVAIGALPYALGRSPVQEGLGPCDCYVYTRTTVDQAPPPCVSSWGVTISNVVWGRCYKEEVCEVPALKCSADVQITVRSKPGMQCQWRIQNAGQVLHDNDKDGSIPAKFERECSEIGTAAVLNFYADNVHLGDVYVSCGICGFNYHPQ